MLKKRAAVESIENRLVWLRQKLQAAKDKHALNSEISRNHDSPHNDEFGLNDTAFLEIFAGAAGLTSAVKRVGGVAISACDINSDTAEVKVFDLTNNACFKEVKTLLKRKKVRWLHLAPPCKTFSKARKRDKWAKVRKLRSRAKPDGLEPKTPLVREANLLASRSAQLATIQLKAGGWFSIENPATSYIWLYKPLVRLAKLDRVQLLEGDQCMFGGEYRKPTGWLTNSPHLSRIAVKCPGGPGHHHPPLEGMVRDFWGEWVWRTALAAEYPQGLCEVLASEYLKHLKMERKRSTTTVQSWKDGGNNKDFESKAYLREVENETCIGGLRNPAKSLTYLPGWQHVGSKLFWAIDELQQINTSYDSLVGLVGTDTPCQLDIELAGLRKHLQSQFGVAEYNGKGIWSELLQRLVQDSKDPDLEAAMWPKLGTPLGILETINPGGVFPEAAEEPNPMQFSSGLDDLMGADGNYQTYHENKEDADNLFLKELEKGFVDWSTDKETLEAKYGQLIQSSVGVIVKQKKEGKKVRLVHDLRRSGVNENIKCSERLVLPRLKDAVDDALDLFEGLAPGEQVALMSLDFKDAFKQLPVRHSEKRFLAGQALGGFFVYHVVLFGIKTGPLVWARIAALVSRATQSLSCWKVQVANIC